MADTDDAMKGLTDSLSNFKSQREKSQAGQEAMKQRYIQWVNDVGYPAIERIAETLRADGAQVQVGKEGTPPTFGLFVAYPDSGFPAFAYLLFLHPSTGEERAFVMHSYSVPNDKYPTKGEKMTKPERVPFYDEHTDGMTNDAPLITEKAIVEDFTKHFAEHRSRSWPARREKKSREKV